MYVEGSSQLSAMLLETETKPMPYSDPCVMAAREDWMGYLNGTPHGQANARLLAAAPELLATLEKLLKSTMLATLNDRRERGILDIAWTEAVTEADALLAKIGGAK